MAPPSPSLPPPRGHQREPHGEELAESARSTNGAHAETSESFTRIDQPLIPESIERSVSVGADRLPLLDVPFAWQHERRLLLLDREAPGWTFAELRFDRAHCRYVEVRRATFRWPREAAGALLARGISFGADSSERLASELERWLSDHQATCSGQNPATD